MDARKNNPREIPSLIALYQGMVERGEIREDAAQREVLAALQRLSDDLAAGYSAFGSWFRKHIGTNSAKGLYIWGNVGRGKSMLMDLFFQNVPDTIPAHRKRRVHFHAFMQEVHMQIHVLRQKGDGDPVIVLAQQIAQKTSLLCFDELQATDVADATLIFRLFEGLFSAGVTIVSTSNHPPATLYTGGVQRERFSKLIALIEQHMRVLALSSESDYRHMLAGSLQKVYFYPLGKSADVFIDDVIARLCNNPIPTQDTLSVQGRLTQFTRYNHTIGRFDFHQLCETALGPADYLAIAKRLDTVILTNIPALSAEKRNEAKRFVTLIDALYEYRVMLICTASVPPEQIYTDGDGAFEFARTVSRLVEMGSIKYIHGQKSTGSQP